MERITDAELLAEMKERGAEMAQIVDEKEAELAQSWGDLRVQVKGASTKCLKKALCRTGQPEAIEIIVADLQERVREDMQDELLKRGRVADQNAIYELDDAGLIGMLDDIIDDVEIGEVPKWGKEKWVSDARDVQSEIFFRFSGCHFTPKEREERELEKQRRIAEREEKVA